MLATTRRPARKFQLMDRREYEVPDASDCIDESHKRIVGVMPLVTRYTNVWLSALKPRERAQFDLDDVLQVAWQTLIEKDRFFAPDRGKYTTFAIMILRHMLSDLRNHCHIVDSPRDSATKLNREGPRSQETLERIRQSIRDVASLEDELIDDDDDPTANEAIKRCAADVDAVQLAQAVLRLGDANKIRILTWSYGLYGQQPLETPQQAERLEISVAQAVQLRAEAECELARLLCPSE